MRRLTGLRLPLTHSEPELRAAICAGFGVADAALRSYHVFRRAWDARKKSDITLVYTIDADLAVDVTTGEPSPDVSYQYVAQAKQRPAKRPVVIGTE
ncbi:MAG: hypothetical protein PHU07_07340, partial [Acidocella sp.]|nr:hypothetical protein [Acidocella sp.]